MKEFAPARVVLSVAIVLSVGTSVARADGDASIHCFSFLEKDSPQRVPAPSFKTEKWCYWDRNIHGESFTLVFNADENRIRPELTALIKRDASHHIKEITHGSLSRGKLSYLKSALTAVNPLPVPLSTEEAARQGTAVNQGVMDALWLDAEKNFSQFADVEIRPFRTRISEGVFESNLEDSLQPFDAYWWPFNGVPLAAGDYSPLGKLDNIVTKWTGTNPNSSSWEQTNHALTNVPWGGHCNGWAASSVLYPEPKKYLWDAENKKVLYPSDQKGMLAEASFCVEWAFYGQRYYGNPGDDLEDIYPDKFHQVLLYYFNYAKKPVAMDYYRDEHVDNSVITGYKMTVKKDPSDSKKWHVLAELKVHHYEMFRNENPGPAVFYTRPYSYELDVDDAGNIVKGKWEGGDNPDFLWVPLAQKNCSGENPNIDPDNVTKIINTFPEAKENTLALNFTLKRTVKASEEIKVPFATAPGLFSKIHVGANDYTGLTLVVKGHVMYPENNTVDEQPFGYFLDNLKDQDIPLSVNDISEIKLVNSTTKEIKGTKLELGALTYLGAN